MLTSMYSYTLYTLQDSNHCCLITRTRTTVCMVYTCTNTIIFLLGLCPKLKNEWNKWKNHFSEMKGDVGMSLHEKERNKKMPTQRQKVIQPHPYIFVSFSL